MATYRIHRLKRHLQQSFSIAPHVSGTANVKPRDYDPGPDPSQNPFVSQMNVPASETAESAPIAGRAKMPIAPLPPETVEAVSPYAAFFALREEERGLNPGDLLETEAGALRIYKYVGFDEAQWVFAEPRPVFVKESGKESGKEAAAGSTAVEPEVHEVAV